MRCMLALALALATAGCSSDGGSGLITSAQAPSPIYQRTQDAQLPVDQRVSAMQSAATGCSIEAASTETSQLPPFPGDASSAVHMQLALQDSPANTVIGDAHFDACMRSLGYDRIR